MNSQTQSGFDQLVNRLDRPAQIAREMKELASADPDLARWLLAQLTAAVGSPSPTATKTTTNGKSRKITKYDKIAAVFVASQNQLITKEALTEAAGVSSSAIHTVLYTTNPDSFERLSNPDGSRAVVVRLKPAALEAAKQKAQGGVHG
jgi:hypothetical protein